MVVNLSSFYSHPGKLLVEHIAKVVSIVQMVTSGKAAYLAALFHDLGKINPNFQQKVNGYGCNSYSSHAYLSAYAFLCYCEKNLAKVMNDLDNRRELIALIIAAIAHHHGDLPNFEKILYEDECERLLDFLKTKNTLPISDFLISSMPHFSFSLWNSQNQPYSHYLRDNSIYDLIKRNDYPLDFFLQTRDVFSSLVFADKCEASGYEKGEMSYDDFYKTFSSSLKLYVGKFSQEGEMNQVRSAMRVEALRNIVDGLTNNKRVFSLTAPTGSGKTTILLSLADKILERRGPMRIIYTLPYLTITEQVEELCLRIFKNQECIRRIDSKSENIDFDIYEQQPDDEQIFITKLLKTQFAEDVFDYPFIITSFVRLFETLLSNHNATMLKLVNFSKTIFLIDEIQTLPPRIYGFFVALIEAFCKKFDSYAIISTATMPNFALPSTRDDLKVFWDGYNVPSELLNYDYFSNSVFDRYAVYYLDERKDIPQLTEEVLRENSSTMVVLNTVDDTMQMYNNLKEVCKDKVVVLLNTRFTLKDRQHKLTLCNEVLYKKKLILISTQLIEAGVDIDFPVVYRDICPLPNIIQAAGRCNRNGKIGKGKVVVFSLCRNNTCRSTLIYRGRDSYFLDFVHQNLKSEKIYDEHNLFNMQKSFFDNIQTNTLWGIHYSSQFNDGEIDFVKAIKQAAFAEIGKFRLIEEQEFGKEYRFYISEGNNDDSFEILINLRNKLNAVSLREFEKRKFINIQIDNQLRKMAGNIVQARINFDNCALITDSEECCGIFKLSRQYYSSETGLELNGAAVL